MPSLKEIKARIASVKTTRKITAAMKMVSAAKLNRAQKNIAGMRPYSKALHHILDCLLADNRELDPALTVQRPPERIAIIAFASDSALAGSFNANVIKEMRKTLKTYRHLPKTHIYIYTIGKKITEATAKTGYRIARHFNGLPAKPDYQTMASLADDLIAQFRAKTIDRVEVVYHHFKSAGAQILTHENFLPLPVSDPTDNAGTRTAADYIFEPSAPDVLAELLPKVLRLKLYTILLDACASEHAARVVAMQIATDNADQLVGELSIEYNKSRQQAITNEILDIIGGSLK